MAGRHNADFFVTLAIAGVAGAAVSVVIGLPALRISGLYLAVTTLAFSITMQDYFLSPTYFRSFLPTFSQRVARPILYGRYSLTGDRAFYYTCLVILALALLSARAVRKSRAGRVMIAVRDNQKGAQAYAVGARAAKLWAFAISGFWAAVAGALYTYQQGSVPPAAFPPELSLTLVVVLVIGGVTSLTGAVMAAVLYGILLYGDVSQSLQLAGIGIVGVGLLYLAPGGFAQIFYGARDGALRSLAKRRKIIVPSLVADVRVPTEPNLFTGAAPPPSEAPPPEPEPLSLGGRS
jgi:branched-chain amino acid transport system permease protein